jgi:DNA-binding IclR family transcriptional regulator
MAYKSHIDLLKDGEHVIKELRDETGETVQLSSLEDDMVVVLLKEEGIKNLRIISKIGSRVPINWAASGRLLVSDFDDEKLTKLLSDTCVQSPSGKANMDIKSIISEVRQFRNQGYGIEINEANEYAGSVAAPVFDSYNNCIATLSVVVPEQRIVKPKRKKLIEAVTKAAGKLSSRLGGRS